MDSSQFNGDLSTALMMGMTPATTDLSYCNFIQDFIDNKDSEANKVNLEKISSQNLRTNTFISTILSIYKPILDEKSDFYTTQKFECWMKLVQKTLGITPNPMNTNKGVELLDKIIFFLNKIKLNITPIV